MHVIRNKGAPHGWIRDDLWDKLVEFWRQEDFKKLKRVKKKNRASSTNGSLHTGRSTTYEVLKLGRTPTQSEVFARTHTQKEDREWVDKRSADVNDAYDAELKRLQDERQAIIDAGGPEPPSPPPIDEVAMWERVAGGRKQGRIYGMGVVPSHKHLHLFSNPNDDNTASGPPDLREQVTLPNREISQQAEAHAQRVAAVEAVCAEKVQTLESTVQTQSQEVSDLRKAYSDMYSFLTQMRSSGYSAVAMPAMPPPPPPLPPPPLAPSQTLPPQHDEGTGSPA
ncbi:hypothetical protein PIB30_011167 [Stylosanthes scabra]|uniref:Transposase, Ptta/En/Spm, plant n=1 Tax=Stylosanthes scabra TaxID=79078 RepID=A0ABU6R4L5_9FABA|nr:hypothetical protein [Stylosanthes scabra]